MILKIKDVITNYSEDEKSAFLLGGIFHIALDAKERGLFEEMTIEEVMELVILSTDVKKDVL